VGGPSRMWMVPLVALVSLRANAAGPTEKPFPCDKSAPVRDDTVTYVVEGRMRIPKGIDVAVQKGVSIVGRKKGDEEAVLEVQGSLAICGVTGLPVNVDGLWIEPQERFDTLRVTACSIGGGGIRTPKDKVVEGRLFFVEDTMFSSGASLTATVQIDQLDVQRVTTATPVVLTAVLPAGATSKKMAVMVHKGSLTGGLLLDGFTAATVRSAILGGRTVLKDCAKLTVDGCQLGGEVEIRQSAPGRFKDALLTKCDVSAPKLTVYAPLQKGLSEALLVEKCWFNGETDEKAVLQKVVADGEDDGANGVRVKLLKIAEKEARLWFQK
jgi:hypothetical protein